MIYKEITDDERKLLESGVFLQYCYSRKRTAYMMRAEYYSKFNHDEWMQMVLFFKNLCCNCEGEVIGDIPTKDHIIPITLGGTNNIRNIQPLCRQCNVRKKNCIDYRENFCNKHSLILPDKWKININFNG